MAITLTAPSISSTTVLGDHTIYPNIVLAAPSISSITDLGEHFLSKGQLICVYINNVDVSADILFDGTNITDSLGNIKGLSLRTKEIVGIVQGLELVILDKRTDKKIFGGFIKEVTKKFTKKDFFTIDLLVQDYTRYIDLVTSGVTMEGITWEYVFLSYLFLYYCSYITVSPLYVINPGELVELPTGDKSLRSALETIQGQYQRVWYVDYNKYLHYFAPGDEPAPFELSDNSDEVTTFKYIDLEFTEDMVNSEIRGSLRCWEPGLFSGMSIKITNTKMGWASEEFLIYEVTATLIAGDMFTNPIFTYDVAFGSRPKRITERIAPGENTDETGGIRLSKLIIDVDKDWSSIEDSLNHGITNMKFLEVMEWLRVPHGLDADKSASPIAGDMYIATDTTTGYICYADGIWTAIGGGGAELLNPISNDTVANWQSGTATSGASGADLVTIANAGDPMKIHSLWIDVSNLQDGGYLNIRMYHKIDGTERLVYNDTFNVGTVPDGIFLINGTMVINEYLRIECWSNISADNGKSIAYEYVETT